jgi:molybdopterin/thiamine biosynthesis adenylyltransferase
MMDPVVVVGLGGTGGYVADILSLHLGGVAPKRDLVLVDGDTYSFSNRARQRMSPADVGQNKAAATARRISAHSPALRVRAVEHFLSERNAAEILPEGCLVLACPDNFATRLTISRRCQRLRNVAAVFAGNERSDGAIQVLVRRAGRSRQRPIEQYHPEIASPSDRSPADLSCEELAARPGGDQIVFANFMSASLVLNAAFRLLEGGDVSYEEVYFDCVANRTRTCERR